MDSSKIQTFFASTPKGLEEIVENEISLFGEVVKRSSGGVTFRSTPLETIKYLTQTRYCSRIYLQIEAYYIESEKELYERAREKWWHKIFDLKQTFKIQTHIDFKSRDQFNNDLHLSRVLKDAIADSFRDHHDGLRPSVDTKFSDVTFSLRIEKSHKKRGHSAIISIDLCGNSLAHRGYRTPGHQAPLRENLAAAMVYLSEWDSKNVPFYDPMCGSGTILMEAIMLQRNIPPSFIRIKRGLEMKRPPYTFFKHKWFQESKLSAEVFSLFEEIVKKSEKELKDKNYPMIFGFDQSDDSINQTLESIEHLGLNEESFKLEQAEIQDFRPKEARGVVITNPPYGKRLEEVEYLKQTYKDFGDVLKNYFKGHEAFILTSDPELSAEIGLKASRKFRLFNGNLDCRLLKYELY